MCFVIRTNGRLLLGFRGAVLDFRGLDYEIQTLGATEGARFSELQKALITMSILSNLSIRIVLSILKNSEKLRKTQNNISLCQRARVLSKDNAKIRQK